jgi:hypothetical protein
MRKLDPKIIRIGDEVKVINPETFLRCGYPLTKLDLYEETMEKHSDQVDFLLSHTGMHDPKYHLVKYKIIDALAYGFLKQRRFGGHERKIYTDTWKELHNKIGVVRKIKFVKTGIYNHGGHGLDVDDYEPPFLSSVGTHKILLIYVPIMGVVTRIEADNVEKIYREEV